MASDGGWLELHGESRTRVVAFWRDKIVGWVTASAEVRSTYQAGAGGWIAGRVREFWGGMVIIGGGGLIQLTLRCYGSKRAWR
jgi:hypothetical protein